MARPQPDRTLVLDVTRLVSRLPNGGVTGVDRVERAWLDWSRERPERIGYLLRTRWGFVLLGPTGAQLLADMIDRRTPEMPATQKDAVTRLRQHALGRASRLGLARLLRKLGFRRGVYLNTGHSNLTRSVLRQVGQAGLARYCLVHDTLPLDHPEWARAGTVAKFERKMRAVALLADCVIHTAAATKATTERQFARLGRIPLGHVAPLGIDVADPDPVALPPALAQLDRFFLSVGTLEPRKNHALLIDLWEDLSNDPDVPELPPLVLVGRRGWLSPEGLSRITGSPLYGTKILEAGSLPDPAVAALYQRAAALLMPSFAEGYGLPPLEAAALGCPVLLADLPVYRETLGALPVYLNPAEMYSWKAIIKQQLAGSGSGRPKPLVPGPLWSDHFARALPDWQATGRAGPQDE